MYKHNLFLIVSLVYNLQLHEDSLRARSTFLSNLLKQLDSGYLVKLLPPFKTEVRNNLAGDSPGPECKQQKPETLPEASLPDLCLPDQGGAALTFQCRHRTQRCPHLSTVPCFLQNLPLVLIGFGSSTLSGICSEWNLVKSGAGRGNRERSLSDNDGQSNVSRVSQPPGVPGGCPGAECGGRRVVCWECGGSWRSNSQDDSHGHYTATS